MDCGDSPPTVYACTRYQMCVCIICCHIAHRLIEFVCSQFPNRENRMEMSRARKVENFAILAVFFRLLASEFVEQHCTNRIELTQKKRLFRPKVSSFSLSVACSFVHCAIRPVWLVEVRKCVARSPLSSARLRYLMSEWNFCKWSGRGSASIHNTHATPIHRVRVQKNWFTTI